MFPRLLLLATAIAASTSLQAAPTGLDSNGHLQAVARAGTTQGFAFTRLENGVQVRVAGHTKNILFYGPGTGVDDGWFARAAAGKLRLPADGRDYLSLVHIADMATATLAAITRWPSRQALIVADDEPARWGDILRFVCTVAGASEPQPGGRSLMPSFRVRNARARELLAWAPSYSSYRAGLAR